MKKIRFFPIIYTILISSILLSIIWSQQTLLSFTPSGTKYSYVSGHMGDYYAYTYMIKRGQEGHLLFHTAFSDETTPDALNQPFYHAIGLMSRPFPVSPFAVFYVARIVAIGLFFAVLYFVIKRATNNEWIQILAAVCVTTSTAVWTVVAGEAHTRVNWIDYFDLYNKYQHIPPHHYLALACFMGILLVLSSEILSIKKMCLAGILAIAMGLLQPYTSFFMAVVLGVVGVIMIIRDRRVTPVIILSGVLVIISFVMMALSAYILQVVLKAPFASTAIAFGQERVVSARDYAYSLGPLVAFAIWAILIPSVRARPIGMYLIAWGSIPIVLYFLPMIANVTSEYRLFQTYQQVPLGILAAISAGYIANRYAKTFAHIMMIILAAASIVYGGMYYWRVARVNVSDAYIHYFNVYIPDYMTRVFHFLKESTPVDSVVLGGTVVSGMIPVFTNNKVIVGHESTTRNYEQKKTDAQRFYSGTLNESELQSYVKAGHISYILFGIDAPTLEMTDYATISGFREVYRDGSVSILKVLW